MITLQKNKFGQTVGQEIKNWRARKMPPKITMQGKFCILEPIDIDKHAAKLFEMLSVANKGASWTYLSAGPFNDCEEFKKWLLKTATESDTIFYAIIDPKSLHPIGIASYLRINPEHGTIEVGHLHYSKFLKKTPAATETMYLMMKHAFEDLAYRRYEWKCNSLNEASRNAALRLGFKFEGIFRQHHVLKDRNRDTAWFSIIDSEWPEIKTRFERWLSDDNFDSDGNQIKKLNRVEI